MSMDIKFNTVDEMVEWSVKHPEMAKTWKWGLDSSTNWVWDDEEAGSAWQNELREITDEMWGHESGRERVTESRMIELQEAEEALRALRPSQRKVTTWWLREKKSGWRYTSVPLSEELGEALDAVWTKVPAYRGANYTVNAKQGMTLTGMLKRLGFTGIGDQVKAAKAKAEADMKMAVRNRVRRNVEKMAKELIAEMKSGMDLGVAFPVHLSELADMSKYMEESND